MGFERKSDKQRQTLKKNCGNQSVLKIFHSTKDKMASVEERTAFAKLEALKDIRSKTISLEKLKLKLLHDVDSFEAESKCVAEYRREMELLQQEKMAHVEELRQIHADINAMETVIKQAEESKRTAMDSARRLVEDYRPLKHEVDLMRTELLGLEKLPELANEEKERLSTIGILEKPKSILDGPAGWPASMHAAMQHHQQLAAAAAGNRGHPAGAPGSFLAAAAAQHSAMGLGPMPISGPSNAGAPKSLTAQPGVAPPAFRYTQQPPPMKSCLSCHQQIHRNAPICPLCKAKSRSRNPKKPKKKD